jgi:predicted ester cyclase
VERTAFAAPVIPGKEAQADAFFEALRGPRNAEFRAVRRRLGIRERSYAQRSPQGYIVIITVEGENPAEAFSHIADGTDEYTEWFVQQVKDIHGLDLSQPLPPLSELIVDSGDERERNKEVVHRFQTEVINNHNVAALHDLAGPGYLNYIAVRPEPFTLAEVDEPLQMFFDAFPDMTHHAEMIVAEDDLVAVKYTITATHKGAFQGIPPTGRQITVNGTAVYRLKYGKIVEDYPGFSPLDLLQQIGAPAPVA